MHPSLSSQNKEKKEPLSGRTVEFCKMLGATPPPSVDVNLARTVYSWQCNGMEETPMSPGRTLAVFLSTVTSFMFFYQIGLCVRSSCVFCFLRLKNDGLVYSINIYDRQKW